jgi:hypothetical protein
MAAWSELNMQTISLALVLLGSPAPVQDSVIEGVTFASAPGEIYVPARTVAEAFAWRLHWDATANALYVQDKRIDPTYRLWDGTVLLDVESLRTLGAAVTWNAEEKVREVRWSSGSFDLVPGQKQVYVSQEDLGLRAYQGPHLVMSSRASVGRSGYKTPNGEFSAGPYKARMHYSSLYENAPMPWSVQVNGDVFIHGWDGRVGYANSHGCIRLPVDGANPARYFFDWVDTGTPVTVAETWPEVLP